MEAMLATVVDFVSAHRDWAPVLVFLLALGETIAFVSILIPSTAILVGVGALVAAGGLDFAPLWVGASLGALIGSTFSYWLGDRFGPRMLALWPLNKDPALVARGTSAFARWGAVTVLGPGASSGRCARWSSWSRGLGDAAAGVPDRQRARRARLGLRGAEIGRARRRRAGGALARALRRVSGGRP